MCLADAGRAGSSTGCTLHVDVALRNDASATLDSVSLAPFDAAIDRPMNPVAVTVAALANMSLAIDSGVVTVSDTLQMLAVLKDASGNALARPVTYASSNETVATVSANGTVTGNSIGNALIIATSGSKADTARVEVAFGWKSISVTPGSNGPFHACGVARDDRGYCWGSNVTGQLGDGTASSVPVTRPVAVSGGFRFAQISAGVSFTCGITTAGATLCWGTNTLTNPVGSFSGGFGNGTDISSLSPTAAATGLSLRLITTGSNLRACGITLENAGYCWGGGHLGDGSGGTSLLPIQVGGSIAWGDLYQGFSAVCGRSTTGQGFCWGARFTGGIGDGGSMNGVQLTPSAVAGGHNFSMMGIGGNAACGLTTAGRVYCWGTVMDGTQASFNIAPVEVPGTYTFTSIAIDGATGCGLTSTGEALCWGTGIELGNGTTTGTVVVPAPVSGGLRFAKIYAGNRQYCGITAKHIAYCWGGNAFGQLGDGTPVPQRLVPTRVANPG
jgi:alpha-tubulin suppressor-like RCC1 family protein